MSHTLEELKEAVARDYDAVLVVEALDISVEDLLEAFEDRLIRNRDLFTEDDEHVAEIEAEKKKYEKLKRRKLLRSLNNEH
jgi:hypothetical protein